ncbi:MAG: iron ABC transporter permease [Bacteroidetes bacterium]|nr:iron ABC transporter permease [Bacteroidota bacterium]
MSKNFLILLILTAALLIMFMYALTLGSANITISEIMNIFSSGSQPNRDIILNIRLPRILNSVIVGASLSCSGIILQSMLRNNLAEPGLLGISAGAGLGAILTFIAPLSISFFLVTPVSFVFAMITTLIIFFFAKGIKSKSSDFISTNKIILTGIAVSAFVSSINGLLLLLSGSSVMQIIYWLNGGFSGRGWNEFNLGIFFAAAGIAGSFLVSKDLNVLNLSEELAVSLGLDIKKFQRICIVLSSVLAATAVSIAGIISFVGLIIPNLSKLLIGNDHRYAVPCSVILGALFLLAADTVSRMVIAPSEIPVGIVTSLIGAPVFIWLIFRKNR